MKHLFIVSNILNAVHDEKIYPGKAVPFDDPKFIPRYPSSPVGVFQAKNPKLKTFLTYDILPCVPEQMLKLLCIELPSETKNLHFDYLGHPTTGREDSVRKKRVQTLGRMIYDFTLEHEQNKDFLTIGDYYAELMDMLWDLSDMEKYLNSQGEKVKLFSGDAKQQFTYFGLENMSGVYDICSCLDQMRLIVEEGEGSNLLTLTGDINKESHFLKFVQVYTMCQVNVRTQYEDSNITQIIFEFKDAEFEVADQKMAKRWNPKWDEEVDKKIQTEFLLERETATNNYETFEK